jgi:hypothetical protein
LNQSTARKVLTILALILLRSTNNDLLTGPGHPVTDPGKGPAGGGQSDPFGFQKCALSEKWWAIPLQKRFYAMCGAFIPGPWTWEPVFFVSEQILRQVKNG